MASRPSPWVTDADAALLVDYYQLTMAEAYLAEGMLGEATFSLFVRRLPPGRGYLVACGQNEVLRFLEHAFRFGDDALAYLESLGAFSERLRAWLGAVRFEGEVRAVPEGTPLFAGEPILEVTVPLPVAQLLETYVMNQVHLQTVAASKAARVVDAADGRPVVDFGVRRTHGADAGVKVARAFHVAGVAATSNVLAGKLFGLPVAGTMAHSYIQAHDHEIDAFRAFASVHPETTLLVDTYDTLEGVRNVVRLARELGDRFRVRAIRLDSGDLAALAREARAMLDRSGLERVGIFASGGLDEWKIADLVARGAPIDAFGVGTGMGVSADAPSLDLAYKLTEYEGRGRTKLSPEKPILPGRKQIVRRAREGMAAGDVLALDGEPGLEGRPLITPAMRSGRRVDDGREDLEALRTHCADERARLPEPVRRLDPDPEAYPVHTSPGLERLHERIRREVAAG